MTHKIKIEKPYADAVLSGDKTFEVRYDDRGYQKGDVVEFNVIDNNDHEINHPLGRKVGKLEDKLERPQGEWISVSERLPEKEGFYLVFLENEQMLVAHSSGIIANHDFEPKMLAWQPLPEPYKRGGAE